MKKLFNQQNGFTLLEVLLSLTILSVVVIGMMSFFHNSYNYVNENEDKTIAAQIGRNVMNYVEKQNYNKFNGYLSHEVDSNENVHIIALDKTYCDKEVTIKKNNDSPASDATSDGIVLFDNKERCLSILDPLINNEVYSSKTDISIFLMKYNDSETLSSLSNLISKDDPSVHNLPASIKELIDNDKENFSNLLQPNEFIHDHLLKVYVVLEWKDKRDDVVIQGVLSHETIR
ncbi:prepilin-type N-terminal cleavage/methylation domain-containing protein [Bacillus sp. RO2]|jgi:prepilin-type N-terminal cleavage/methylation domain-containing protein|uniref:type IV pilus modification PilV family protein n=1 Tax=Bacillus sp. RO2 TaxID=2723913 RepID=UPI00145C742E|nr:prepilin-type N-terminal cleavage/methylation domain-containing protein [Bacillus sp. RO2]NMH72835.1 prepilin-type N-terminal cleavage/methylation domain-containing protein [Bacillus sp. RO2]